MALDLNIQGVVLETKRLYLREWVQSDLEDFYEYARIPGVGEAAGWVHHQSIEESQKILNMFIDKKDCFAIVSKEDDIVIGSFGIMDYTPNEGVLVKKRGKEIGYVLSKDYWGKGLMSEAANTVKDYLFNECNMDYLICGYFADNNRSKRVAEKLGFEEFGQKEIERPLGRVIMLQSILEK